MEMNLFEVAGEKYTRFKILLSEYRLLKKSLDRIGLTEPSKKSSRYIYFEAKGDFLNKPKAEVNL